jgi:hypothetical protein
MIVTKGVDDASLDDALSFEHKCEEKMQVWGHFLSQNH